MVSMSTLKCNTPRPLTIQLSVASSNGCTRKARFFSNSFCKRSLMWRDVQYLPSFPKKGESLMVKSIDMVGSSTAIGGNGSGFSKSQIVSPISNFSSPITAQISPESTWSVLQCPIPSKVCNSLIFVRSCVPSRCQIVTGIPSHKVPRCTRPTAILPV